MDDVGKARQQWDDRLQKYCRYTQTSVCQESSMPYRVCDAVLYRVFSLQVDRSCILSWGEAGYNTETKAE